MFVFGRKILDNLFLEDVVFLWYKWEENFHQDNLAEQLKMKWKYALEVKPNFKILQLAHTEPSTVQNIDDSNKKFYEIVEAHPHLKLTIRNASIVK